MSTRAPSQMFISAPRDQSVGLPLVVDALVVGLVHLVSSVGVQAVVPAHDVAGGEVLGVLRFVVIFETEESRDDAHWLVLRPLVPLGRSLGRSARYQQVTRADAHL